MKRTNQFERTDRDITNGLLSLMNQKPFEKIAVQDILEEALINRSTFYQHFRDKYEVLEKLQNKLINHLIAEIQTEESNIDSVNRRVFEILSKDQDVWNKLLSIKSESLNLQKQMEDVFEDYIKKNNPKLTKLERQLLANMVVNFMVYSLRENIHLEKVGDTMLKTWLNMTVFFFRMNDIPDASEQLLQYIQKMRK